MRFEKAKEFLYCDGSLRDVYVLKATDAELDAFLDYIRPVIAQGDFYMAGETSLLPDTYSEIMTATGNARSLLQIPVSSGYLNCHFFDDHQLELDFSPADFLAEDTWNALSTFLQDLANAMQREVIMTPENMPEHAYIRYLPAGDDGSCSDGSDI